MYILTIESEDKKVNELLSNLHFDYKTETSNAFIFSLTLLVESQAIAFERYYKNLLKDIECFIYYEWEDDVEEQEAEESNEPYHSIRDYEDDSRFI